MPGAARTNASPRRASSRPEQCRGRRRRPSAVEGCRMCGRNSATPLPRRPPLEPGIYPARPTRHGTPPLLSIPIRSIRKATIRLLSPSAPDKGQLPMDFLSNTQTAKATLISELNLSMVCSSSAKQLERRVVERPVVM
ncbi:hypothetical protein EJB05_21431, partial [Eragrostis curvula]